MVLSKAIWIGVSEVCGVEADILNLLSKGTRTDTMERFRKLQYTKQEETSGI